MTASREAKSAGLKNLKELAESEGQSTQTLGYWYKNIPELFQDALDRAVKKKNEAKNEN